VNIGLLKEAEDRHRLGGLDLILQTLVAIGIVADEADLLEAGLFALADLEHQIDAVVGQFDDLGIDADVEAAITAIDLDDALHVGLHRGARQRTAGFRLYLDVELLVLELLVALERDAVEDRIL